MEQIESIKLVNNSVVSAIDKLNVKDGDTLIFYIRTDENGDYAVPADVCMNCCDFIQKFLNENYNNVKFMMIPDGIRYDNENSNRSCLVQKGKNNVEK